ncbi:nickel ABC transporter permease [Bacillus sp. FJAT-44742]|uniref:nickel ABC transporter permease n=1 Tax=Bacillus sp. FJAT-44742 TaxID=2014005 RepID=UPI000C24EDE2|nr:nickel ABC transporter permease [Bacillus sp. FJAT-44742]
MFIFVIRRLVIMIPVLAGVSLITFFLLQLVPGNPAETYLRLSNIPPTDEAIARVQRELGLDRPLAVQYIHWLGQALQLNFGYSFVTQRPVLEEVLYYFPATIVLTFASVVMTVVFSIPVGILSAIFRNRLIDKVMRFSAIAGNSMPSFWLGFLLMYFFSLKLNLFPASGTGSLAHIFLPTMTLAIPYIAIYSRLLRTSFLESKDQPFVIYSKARGIKPHVIYGKHILRHALLPCVTIFGISIGYMLSGTIIVESVFSWPGIGRYFVSAILNRDYPVIQFSVMFMAITFMLINLLVDIIYAYLEPRIRWNSEVGHHD